MAKRTADEQITRENYGLVETGNEVPHESIAPPDIMAKRKILKPKGKSFQFSDNLRGPSNVKYPPNILPNSAAERLKALANKFADSIVKLKTDQAVPDYRPLAHKYLKYYEEIETLSEGSKTSTPGSTILGSQEDSRVNKLLNPFVNISNDGKDSADVSASERTAKANETAHGNNETEPRQDFKLDGPKFNMSSIPTTKKPAFTFGVKKESKKAEFDSDSDSDSEPDVKIQGPTFTFSKEIKDPIFNIQTQSSIDGATSASSNVTGIGARATSASTQPPKAFQETGSDFASKSTSIFPGTSELLKNSKDVQVSAFEGESKGNESGSEDDTSRQVVTFVPADEENKNVLFSVKTRLMMLKTENVNNPYQSLGVGELKVLKSEGGSSSRVLIRAEGGLRVLLNAFLIKDVEYTTMGNGCFVRFPALDDQHQIVTYVFKVGSAENGEKLCSTLNSAKTN